MLIIHDENHHEHCIADPVVDGEHKARGCKPRDFEAAPPGCYRGSVTEVTIPLVPDSEWAARCREKDEAKSWLTDIRMTGAFGQPIPARDQGSRGYCWIHSGTSAVLLIRARDNMPYADLSAYFGACIIKSYRDEGGWGAQGVDWIMEKGMCTSEFWAQRATARLTGAALEACYQNALLYCGGEGWMDLSQSQYDRKLSWQQRGSLWLSNVPTIDDYNHWSHSVCGCKLVNGQSDFMRALTRLSTGKLPSLQQYDKLWMIGDPIMMGFGTGLLNSWGNGWGELGYGILTGSKAQADGCTAITSMRMAA